jgi:hypothetical protein
VTPVQNNAFSKGWLIIGSYLEIYAFVLDIACIGVMLTIDAWYAMAIDMD